MVQLADGETTLSALRSACLRALRERPSLSVTLLYLSRIQHLSWLGAPGDPDFPNGASKQTAIECASVATQYGVEVVLLPFQYHSLLGAIGDAADHVDATVVFANLPHSRLPGVDRLQVSLLRRQLAEHGRELVLANGHGFAADSHGRHLYPGLST
jgi:hypothetical protein